MKYKCECGKIHNFQAFRKQKRRWGGVSTWYQFFCREINDLIIIETSTYPRGITDLVCFSNKKYRRCFRLMTAEEYMS